MISADSPVVYYISVLHITKGLALMSIEEGGGGSISPQGLSAALSGSEPTVKIFICSWIWIRH
jgi:hypothetical protein